MPPFFLHPQRQTLKSKLLLKKKKFTSRSALLYILLFKKKIGRKREDGPILNKTGPKVYYFI